MKTITGTALALAAACALCLAVPARAEGITITQIDASRLLTTQTVRLYLDIDSRDGNVSTDGIKIGESPDGDSFTDARVRKVSRTANRDEGISFFLLLDNSGSMWDGLDGKATDDPADTRMAHAKRAIGEFVASLAPNDRAGLGVFNTGYKTYREMTSDTGSIGLALDEVSRPARDEGYTELYEAIRTALRGFGETGRRKALVILSDGEHFPFSAPNDPATPEDDIDAAIREGVTCYAVNFGKDRDNHLPRIAGESGGLVFDAGNSEELLGIYTAIRASILDEYAVDYEAAMFPGEKRYVKAAYAGGGGSIETTREYYSGTVLGSNTRRPRAFYALFFLVPLALWVALLVFKLERETTSAGIQLLYGAKGGQTKNFALTSAQTVIGGDDTADITIAGNPAMRGNAATIVFDKTKGQYTISATSDLTVNNKPVKTKRLEPGDVINMSGTVVVFDDAAKDTKRKPR